MGLTTYLYRGEITQLLSTMDIQVYMGVSLNGGSGPQQTHGVFPTKN